MRPLKETLPTIIEMRDPEETCSQYVFGSESYFVDEALDAVTKSGYHKIPSDTELQPDDIMFYFGIGTNVTHVAKAGKNGLLQSKFTGDPQVYTHTRWGKPIPDTNSFQYSQLYRKVPSEEAG